MIYIHKLVPLPGFIEEFWRLYREKSKDDPTVTQEQVFDMLNEQYLEVFGIYRFKSFDAFRKQRDRKQ